MKLSIVNFSDVHFMAGNNSILEKKQQLIKAIASRINSSEKKLFLMNGDSAFSGKQEEYDVAFDFFRMLFLNLKELIFYVFPGNHDCNFSVMDSVIRETILERIKDNEDKRENLIQKITLQDHYDDYFSKFMEFWESSELISDFPIFKVREFLNK